MRRFSFVVALQTFIAVALLNGCASSPSPESSVRKVSGQAIAGDGSCDGNYNACRAPTDAERISITMPNDRRIVPEGEVDGTRRHGRTEEAAAPSFTRREVGEIVLRVPQGWAEVSELSQHAPAPSLRFVAMRERPRRGEPLMIWAWQRTYNRAHRLRGVSFGRCEGTRVGMLRAIKARYRFVLEGGVREVAAVYFVGTDGDITLIEGTWSAEDAARSAAFDGILASAVPTTGPPPLLPVGDAPTQPLMLAAAPQPEPDGAPPTDDHTVPMPRDGLAAPRSRT